MQVAEAHPTGGWVMLILGIHDGHNASACLYRDGVVEAAIQEERLCRVKNWSGLPLRAVDAVLRTAGASLGDVDVVAMNGHYPTRVTGGREGLIADLRSVDDPGVVLRRAATRAVHRMVKPTPLYGVLRERRQRARVGPLLARSVPFARFVPVEHHLAHTAAAYYGLANFEDDILVLTCDGSGDGVCATVSLGRGGRLERLHAVAAEHSVGALYEVTTCLMGMVPEEHEYKVMGLAPYADPRGARAVHEDLRRLVRFDPARPLGWERSGGCPDAYRSYGFLRRLFEGRRFDAIAGGLQRFTEDVLATWVRNCIRATGVHRLALGGGVFMNVKATKVLMELPEVEDLFVYPSPGDETSALGAAYSVHAATAGVAKMTPLRDLYWGPHLDEAAAEAALRRFAFRSPVTWDRHPAIERRVAALLAGGTVVARMAGRDEFGARALGNRSILAHPARRDVVRVINEAIKARDFWMPFAPAILAERGHDYLVKPKPVASPYMILAFDTQARRRDEIAAAIHPFDGTARPQEVSAESNPGFHRLLVEFERLTGIGAVLNTSFNLHGHPIVSTPEDALDVFDRSGLTHLALGDWLVEKR
jgi:carbamoyltransferase